MAIEITNKEECPVIYGFELTNEHWLVGYGLDAADGTKRNLPHILGYLPED